MNIIPLADYPAERRSYEKKHRSNWARDARGGKIPGAFQFSIGGDWFVDLDIHDAEVHKRTAQLRDFSPELDEDLQELAKALGMSEEDVRIASNAIRG